MKLILASLLLFAGQAFALDYSADCRDTVYSQNLQRGAEAAIKKIDRTETAYTAGVSVTDWDGIRFCAKESSKDDVTVGLVVTAKTWSEEGDVELQVAECFIRLQREDSEWVGTYLTCEEFGIDEDL